MLLLLLTQIRHFGVGGASWAGNFALDGGVEWGGGRHQYTSLLTLVVREGSCRQGCQPAIFDALKDVEKCCRHWSSKCGIFWQKGLALNRPARSGNTWRSNLWLGAWRRNGKTKTNANRGILLLPKCKELLKNCPAKPNIAMWVFLQVGSGLLTYKKKVLFFFWAHDAVGQGAEEFLACFFPLPLSLVTLSVGRYRNSLLLLLLDYQPTQPTFFLSTDVQSRVDFYYLTHTHTLPPLLSLSLPACEIRLERRRRKGQGEKPHLTISGRCEILVLIDQK